MLLQHGMVLDGDFCLRRADLLARNGRIERMAASLLPPPGEEILDCTGCTVIPGLVDIHTHACGGADTCDASEESLALMSRMQAEAGVTSFMPTAMTLPEDRLAAAFSCIDRFAGREPGARIAGIYLEGPFFSEEYKGAQAAEHLRCPDLSIFRRLQQAAGGRIRVVSLAPELPGSEAFIRTLSQEGETVVAVGHTGADYDTAARAFQWGACHVTHLFNAMPPMIHRRPGVVGAALDSDATVELICDGVHIHPAVIRLAFGRVGARRAVLISDSMAATGMPDGLYMLGGQQVEVRGGVARLAEDVLAGSTTNLMGCVRCAVSMGIPLEDAVRAASLNPARVIGAQQEIGSLEVGKRADAVVLGPNLEVRAVLLAGHLYRPAGAAPAENISRT